MEQDRDWEKPIILTTGGEEEQLIIDLRDEFFDHVTHKLGFVSLSFIDIPFMSLRSSALGTEHPSGFIPSDDRLHQLEVCNELIATVIDRRNDGNYHEVTFWDRSPGDICARQIQEIVTHSRNI